MLGANSTFYWSLNMSVIFLNVLYLIVIHSVLTRILHGFYTHIKILYSFYFLGRWEGGSGWGRHVNSRTFHFNVWQNSLQIKKKKKERKLKCTVRYNTALGVTQFLSNKARIHGQIIWLQQSLCFSLVLFPRNGSSVSLMMKMKLFFTQFFVAVVYCIDQTGMHYHLICI